jgi:hypothetical protein
MESSGSQTGLTWGPSAGAGRRREPNPTTFAAERKDLVEATGRPPLERRVNVLDAQILLLDKASCGPCPAPLLDHILERGPWPLAPAVWQGAVMKASRRGWPDLRTRRKAGSVSRSRPAPYLALATLVAVLVGLR